MVITAVLAVVGISIAAFHYNKAKNRAIQIRRNAQYGYMAFYRTEAAKFLDVAIFEIKEMRCYAITSHIYETLAAMHGVKDVQMKTYRKHAVVVFNPKEVDKEYVKQILERKMHFTVREIEYGRSYAK